MWAETGRQEWLFKLNDHSDVHLNQSQAPDERVMRTRRLGSAGSVVSRARDEVERIWAFPSA